jgi:hypothetical protein
LIRCVTNGPSSACSKGHLACHSKIPSAIS